MATEPTADAEVATEPAAATKIQMETGRKSGTSNDHEVRRTIETGMPRLYPGIVPAYLLFFAVTACSGPRVTDMDASTEGPDEVEILEQAGIKRDRIGCIVSVIVRRRNRLVFHAGRMLRIPRPG